ncbi:MAG: sigma-70 family RNA polymerase sigma factor [Candidatus Woesearchaeota archaeon]
MNPNLEPLGKIYSTLFPCLVERMTQLGVPDDLAEEVAAQTFYQAVLNHRHLPSEDRLTAWLTTICYHQLDHSSRVRDVEVTGLNPDTVEAPEDNPEIRVSRREGIEQVLRLVDPTLPRDCALVLDRFIYGGNYHEVAPQLGAKLKSGVGERLRLYQEFIRDALG